MTTPITIEQDDLGDGVVFYEIRITDGAIVWNGLGADPAHGLLQNLIKIAAAEQPEPQQAARAPAM